MDIDMVKLKCPSCGYEMDLVQTKDRQIFKDPKDLENIKCPNCHDQTLVRS